MTARRYATPAAFAQALEQRLRDRAADQGTDLGRLRQILVFDRMLARLVRVFGERLVVKGGLVLELRLTRARTTRDIDLRLTGDPAQVLPQLQEAGRLDLGDHLSYVVRPDPRHPDIEAEGMRYQGLRFRAEARLAGRLCGNPFGVDVAFAEPLSSEPEAITGSELLAFAGVAPAELRIYPVETHIAEKLHAYTLPRARPNSRTKDLPDMALLGSVRPLDGTTLREAIDRTFGHRQTHPVPANLPAPPEAWTDPYARMATVDRLPWPTLAEVTRAVRAFLKPVLAGRGQRWNPEDWSWSGAPNERAE